MRRRVVFCLLTLCLILGSWIILSAEEPCEGGPIEAVNDDPCELKKWIGVEDSTTVCQILCLMEMDPEKCGINPSWIGGKVIFDEQAEYGFYFDPATVIIAEIVAETYQTNTCQISEDPKYYDGGTWYIPYNIVEVNR